MVEKRDITGGSILARNTIWNLTGQILPFAVALWAIPVLITGLGSDRFGLLSLVWMFIGYFSLFDFGLGRALTQLVAEKTGHESDDEVYKIITTSLLLMFVLGIVGAVVVFFIAPMLVSRLLNVPASIQREAIKSFQVLAYSIPFVVSAAGLRGVLEARQRFDLINYVRIPLGILVFAGPALTVSFSTDLSIVVTVLAGSRVLAWGVFAIICSRVFHGLFSQVAFHLSLVPSLLRFGGWMTVTNIVGPMMVYLDRFLIGSVVSMAAVAYYVAPYEVATKLLVIPGALVGVLFPAFSASLATNPERAKMIFSQGLSLLLVIMFPVIMIIMVFAPEGLRWWVGEDFAQQGTFILRILLFGIFVNSLAMLPFALVQGHGRPDLTAKLHLLELPFYLLLVWFGIKHFGIIGAAIVWSIRAFVDMVILMIIARRWVIKSWPQATAQHLFMVGALSSFVICSTLDDILLRGLFLLIVSPLFLYLAWRFLLTAETKKYFFNLPGIRELAS